MTDRHPGTEHLLSLFDFDHLPPHLRGIAGDLCSTAHSMVAQLADGPELTTGLRKLLEAKDCFVRQAVVDERDRPKRQHTIKAGSIRQCTTCLAYEPERDSECPGPQTIKGTVTVSDDRSTGVTITGVDSRDDESALRDLHRRSTAAHERAATANDRARRW